MADSKPAWERVKKDELAGLKDNFGELINWLVSCWLNARDGDGNKIKGVEDGKPICGGGSAVWG